MQEQFDAAWRLIDSESHEPYYKIRSQTDRTKEYIVRALKVSNKYLPTCTCPAGLSGTKCWRKRVALAHLELPINLHRDVMVAAAQAGKHIFTEKVLAPTLHECNEIMAAVSNAGVILMVSLPRLYAGYTLAIKNILDRKLLGELVEVRTHISHDGALRTKQNPQGWLPPYFFDPQQSAGGAMIDLGSHSMYLTRLFLGLPESVSATYGYITGRAVEDNAVVVLHYAEGKIGVAESGFVNRFSPFTIGVHGTEGSLLYGTPESKLQIRSPALGKDSWSVWTDVPADLPAPFQQWVSHIQQGTPATENIQGAIDLSMLMEAANRSAASHQPVRLNTLAL